MTFTIIGDKYFSVENLKTEAFRLKLLTNPNIINLLEKIRLVCLADVIRHATIISGKV